MFALPLRRRFLPSWSACCGRAGLVTAMLLIPALRVAAQDTTPAHHPHHTHGTASHHHGAAHPHPRQALHAKPAAPEPASPAPAPTAPPSAPSAAPAPTTPANKGSNTGLPLPRFAALRADEVNMRSGPGTRYPILWLYKRRDLPVRIEREFDVWRLVEDSDGVKGWVHQATLVGTRTFVVTASAETSIGTTDRGSGVLLRDDPRDDAGVVAILRPGVIGRLRDCPSGSGWCRVTTHNYSGWLQRSAIFGLLPNEVITPP